MKKLLIIFSMLAYTVSAQTHNYNHSKFKQLKEELATPNVYRTGSGAPGHAYYQNTADYVIKVELNDDNQTITGSETIKYTNHSPDKLTYLWMQLDQNVRAEDSDSKKARNSSINDMSFRQYKNMNTPFDGGFKLSKVQDAKGSNLDYTINKTMMRIDLDKALAPGQSISLRIEWMYNINDRMKMGGRSGYEHFEENDNYLYTIAQFFPRMCVYNDIEGWQNKQFLGSGEFTLPFGNYDVQITVPSDHIVASTGELVNPKTVLTSAQQKRFEKAKNEYRTPVIIVTEDEARENEKTKSTSKKTWRYKATNVRDFAFASSRKFIWDAMAVKQNSHDVMAMSYYPKEGNPLWEKFSTQAVAQTLETYTRHTFDYPYPVAISVNAAQIGMEYPMICFNYGRTEEDGTYSERTKYGMIGVIIHEVGHNYFPMIINSDERQWTWMDEGLNTFLEYLTEQDWDTDFPSRRGPARHIVPYMKGSKDKMMPIMTNSESILQFGNNAYGKPATALNILRETVMGRELFDHAFKTYAQRWMFKQPSPADFFRTMEDASAVDLDWFWRAWFFTTDNVDIAITGIKHFQMNNGNPDDVEAYKTNKVSQEAPSITDMLNKKEGKVTRREKYKELEDFYNSYDPNKATKADKQAYEELKNQVSDEEFAMLEDGKHYYNMTFENVGGIVMPLIIEFTFENGEKELVRLPVEVWVRNNFKAKKMFSFDQKVTKIQLDPYLETADTDVENNVWPKSQESSQFELYQGRRRSGKNPMQNQ